MRTGWVVVWLSLVGCRQILGLDDPSLAGTGDGGAGDAFDSDAPDAGPCPQTSAECAGSDVLRSCAAVGAAPVDTVCAWGCATTGEAHCSQLVPRGGVVIASDLDAVSVGDIVLAAPTTIDTDTGEITGVRAAGENVISGIKFEARPGGGVFTFGSLTIAADVDTRGSRPLVIIALDGATIDALLDLRGPCTPRTAGPGGFTGGASGAVALGQGAGGGGGNTNENGGGGGGHGGIGGRGGNDGLGFGGISGPTIGDIQFTTLVGGGGGGGGGDPSGGAVGGGGGGAVQLVSNGAIVVSSTGAINAGGCGGQTTVGNDAGGGGGAGGTILLEAATVTVDGVLAVNGGGGGAGEGGAPGENGQTSRAAALGGDGGAAGDGGNGAAPPFMVGADGEDDGNAGGGGGGIGRIRIHTRTGTSMITGVMSPSFTDSNTTATQGAAGVQ